MAITKPLFAGDDTTPESVKRRRALADALLAQGGQVKNIDSPIETLGSIAQSLGGYFGAMRADREETAGLQSRRDAMTRIGETLLGGGGGYNASTPSSFGGSSAQMLGSSPGPTPSSPAGNARAAAAGPSPSALPASFLASVDRTEGGGNYDTLFGHSQRSGPFSNVRISNMTVGQAIDFASPSGAYGQFVKGKVGHVATPMGRHQIVGSTLRRAASEMGLDPSTPFDAQTQDAVAAHLARRRVASANTTSGKIAALRSEWEGFKHVPDAQMAQIVADLESGAAPAPSAPRPVQVASLDPNEGMAAALGAQPANVSPANQALGAALTGGSVSPSPMQPQAAQAAPSPDMSAMAAQMTGGQQPQPAQGVNRALIAELLGNPWTEDMGQQLLMQGISQQQEAQAMAQQQAYERAMLTEQRQYDAGLLQGERAYDDRVRQEGFQREDARNAYTDGRQVMRDNRADLESDRSFGLQQEQLTPTSVREYEYAVEGGYQGSFADYEQTQRRAGATNIVQNAGEGNKFYDTLDAKNAENIATLSQGGQAARGRLAQIEQLGTLIENSPSGFEARVKMMLGDFGVPTEGLDALQATVALVEKMVPEQREPGSGPMSDADLAGFRRSLPSVFNQAGGNAFIVGRIRAIAEYDIKRGEIADMISDRSITPAEGRTLLRDLENPLDGYNDKVRELFRTRSPEAPATSPQSPAPLISGAGVPAEPRGAMPMVQTKEAYDALPSGAVFVAPDGQVRSKP